MKTPKRNILYVDDEEINLRLFYSTFRRDYNIFLATNAHEGLDILTKQKIDLIITDQRMPETTGVEFLGKVLKVFPEIPPGRLIISGYSDPEDIDLAFEKYHLYKFISKPWNHEELHSIINKALNND